MPPEGRENWLPRCIGLTPPGSPPQLPNVARRQSKPSLRRSPRRGCSQSPQVAYPEFARSTPPRLRRGSTFHRQRCFPETALDLAQGSPAAVERLTPAFRRARQARKAGSSYPSLPTQCLTFCHCSFAFTRASRKSPRSPGMVCSTMRRFPSWSGRGWRRTRPVAATTPIRADAGAGLERLQPRPLQEGKRLIVEQTIPGLLGDFLDALVNAKLQWQNVRHWVGRDG